MLRFFLNAYLSDPTVYDCAHILSNLTAHYQDAFEYYNYNSEYVSSSCDANISISSLYSTTSTGGSSGGNGTTPSTTNGSGASTYTINFILFGLSWFAIIMYIL